MWCDVSLQAIALWADLAAERLNAVPAERGKAQISNEQDRGRFRTRGKPK
ncbi:hypothetical protein [Rhodobacter sp. 24-YEA-8]|nr:hypothetical protein [Rhodobacter sp. 24-YEA-8]